MAELSSRCGSYWDSWDFHSLLCLKSFKKEKGESNSHPEESSILQTAPALHSMGPREGHPENLGHHFQILKNLSGAEFRGKHSEQHKSTLVMRWREEKRTTGNVNIQKSTRQNTTQKGGRRPVRRLSTPGALPALGGPQPMARWSQPLFRETEPPSSALASGCLAPPLKV